MSIDPIAFLSFLLLFSNVENISAFLVQCLKLSAMQRLHVTFIMYWLYLEYKNQCFIRIRSIFPGME